MSKNEKLENLEELKVGISEKVESVTGEKREFPKYTRQLINIANQNAQGTRPEVVGKVSELIKECPKKSYEGWKEWYLEKRGDSIKKAVDRIMPMVNKMKGAAKKIDKEMVKKWVEDLVIDKTAEGLIIQEIILKELSKKYEVDYKLASPEEESKNIDGYLGKLSVSIKPETYLSKKPTVREEINVPIIYYKKTKKYLRIYYDKDELKDIQSRG